jgi:hypothetical protein
MVTYRPLFAASLLVSAVSAFVSGCAPKAQAQAPNHAQLLFVQPQQQQKPQQPPPSAQYPVMAPIEQYLDDRDAEIALARSAAPSAISADATVLVLTRQGFQTAVEGKNGFVCFVDRPWTSPFEDPEFWNPKKRGPTCMNAPAARSALPVINRLNELALAGQTKEAILLT